MSFLRRFEIPLSIAQLLLDDTQLILRYFPKPIDFIALELHVVSPLVRLDHLVLHSVYFCY